MNTLNFECFQLLLHQMELNQKRKLKKKLLPGSVSPILGGRKETLTNMLTLSWICSSTLKNFLRQSNCKITLVTLQDIFLIMLKWPPHIQICSSCCGSQTFPASRTISLMLICWKSVFGRGKNTNALNCSNRSQQIQVYYRFTFFSFIMLLTIHNSI